MSAAPFADEVEQLIAAGHEAIVTARAVTPEGEVIELDLIAYDVEWDEARSPRVTAGLDCVVPDQATLDKLDPRRVVRIQITAGYRLPSGVLDAHQVADLHLRVRRVRRPDNVMSLTCASDEFLLIDAAPNIQIYEGSGVLLHDSAAAFIEQTAMEVLIAGGPLDGVAQFVNTTPFDPSGFPYDATPADWWNGIRDAADSIDADFYDNGDRVFRLAPRRYLSASPDLSLKVGAGGTIITSDAGLDRDQFYNDVRLLWTWDNSANPEMPDRVWGLAYVADGPLAEATAGRRVLTQQREGQVSAGVAQRAAETVLRRRLSRSRSYTIQAVAAWWLRPSDTVGLLLPTGDVERHLVARVSFRTGGTMTIDTRTPDYTSVIGE